jgi:uncharacterized repeat protein (TIGR01451 family)
MQKLKYLTILFILAALLVAAGGVVASPGAVAPDLGAAATFVGLAFSTFTNTGSGVYYGNVGVFPGTSVIGFPPGSVRNGAIHSADGVAAQAMSDATTAYNVLAGQACNVNLTGQDLGGMTLTPGVYCFNTSAQLTGDLVLDALGNPNAVWVFKIGSTLTTASGSSVGVINGGQAVNVFWQVGSSATLGTTTRFSGNILAYVSVTLNTGASLIGRALALHGAVTMDTEGSPPITNIPIIDLSIVKRVNPINALPGQPVTYTLTFANVGNELVTGVTITDSIPLSVTNTSVISNGVAITAVGGTRYAWNIASLAAGQGGVITITGVLSSGLQAGDAFTNTAVITTTLGLDSDASNNSSSVGVTVAPMPDLSIVKRVNPVNALPGQPVTYTLTFANVGNELVTGVTITDSIPLSVTSTSVISNGVAITAVGGTRYAWNIAPLAVGQGGVITITGVLSSGLQAGDAFTNTAVITTTLGPDSDASNNSSSVGVTVAPMTYTLTVNIVGSGSVTREPPGTVRLPSYIYLAGTMVTLTATPDTDWYFSGWSGYLSSATNSILVTMNANKVLTATFRTSGFLIYLPLVRMSAFLIYLPTCVENK